MLNCIAILGWGSLLWDSQPSFDDWHEPWKPDGPTLPLEFSRISKKRGQALTLVIDERHGTATQVAWCASRRRKWQDAFSDLRCREGTTNENIHVFRAEDGLPSGSADSRVLIARWAVERRFDVVIWTGLSSNFEKETGEPFSVKTAVAHIQTLDVLAKLKAAEYVWRAPDFVTTSVREALQCEPWFSR